MRVTIIVAWKVRNFEFAPAAMPFALMDSEGGIDEPPQCSAVVRRKSQEKAGHVAETGHPLRQRRNAQRRDVLMSRNGAQGRNRTTDTAIFNRMLYQLSYLGAGPAGTGGEAERGAL